MLNLEYSRDKYKQIEDILNNKEEINEHDIKNIEKNLKQLGEINLINNINQIKKYDYKDSLIKEVFKEVIGSDINLDNTTNRDFKIKEDNLGEVRIADEVVAIIAGLAATEVEGVSSMAGNITNELVSKLGMKNLSKGVRVEVLDGSVEVEVALNIAYGFAIPDVSAKVQEKVKTAIETMTGLNVALVNVRIASVDMGGNK